MIYGLGSVTVSSGFVLEMGMDCCEGYRYGRAVKFFRDVQDNIV